jgi:hypothetical protein
MQSELNLRFRAAQHSPIKFLGFSLDRWRVAVDRLCRVESSNTMTIPRSGRSSRYSMSSADSRGSGALLSMRAHSSGKRSPWTNYAPVSRGLSSVANVMQFAGYRHSTLVVASPQHLGGARFALAASSSACPVSGLFFVLHNIYFQICNALVIGVLPCHA